MPLDVRDFKVRSVAGVCNFRENVLPSPHFANGWWAREVTIIAADGGVLYIGRKELFLGLPSKRNKERNLP